LIVWEKSKSSVINKNRENDVYLKNPEGGVVFIPQGWCDQFDQDPEEEAEIMAYIQTSMDENGPVDTLYVPVSRLDAMSEITKETAQQIHPEMFKTLDRINAGDDVTLR
jgi:hypothetical protein